MKQAGHWLRSNYRLLLLALLALAVVSGLLIFRLGSLTGQLAASEQPLPTFHSSLHAVWNNPLNLPLVIARLVVAALSPYGGLTSSRLPSVLLGLLTIALFYLVVRHWYGWRIGIYGSLMLSFSPWFLHATRLSSNVILYPLAITILLNSYVWCRRQQNQTYWVWLALVSWCFIVYIPGMVWLIAIVKLFDGQTLRTTFSHYSKRAGLALLVPIGLLAPLVHQLINTPHSYRAYLGLPGQLPALSTLAKQFAIVPYRIALKGPLDPTINLGRLALLDTFTLGMLIVGLYLYIRHWNSGRSRLLASLAAVSWILIALQSNMTIIMLLPIIFVVASGGLAYLLHVWLRVFPRNPLARGFGMGLVSLTLVFAVAYDIRQYFVAWPNDPATRAAFVTKP